jgi:glycosyltransferase involved in cell wall biosynthesis
MPCYNEESRLSLPLVETLVSDGTVTLVLVDDGSTDETATLLRELEASSEGRIFALHLPNNRGKAEAVRTGLQWAIDCGARQVGYADADFATPPVEILRLLRALDDQELGAVLGSRIALIGAHIERTPFRHATSRIFAAIASYALRLNVYDSQCGAKWFQVNDALRGAISHPFSAGWAFDVELLGRLMGRWGEGPRIDDDALLEIPIRAWRDVDGSKVRLTGMIRALLDLARMGLLSRRLGERHTASLRCVAPRPRLRTSARDSWLPSMFPAMLPSLALPAPPSVATESVPPADTESGVRLAPGAEPATPQKAGGKRGH